MKRQSLFKKIVNDTCDLTFFNPTTDKEIKQEKSTLNITLSGELAELLQETIGIQDKR